MAAYQNSCDNTAMVRRFGTTRFRILLHLQVEITELEKQLDELDLSDSNTGPDSETDYRYRLRINEWHEGWDRKQKDLIQTLKEKLSEYGRPIRRTLSCSIFLLDLTHRKTLTDILQTT